MSNRLFNSLQLTGFLSFAPTSEPVELTALNVLIGPNGVGKSNFIEAIELLHATPTDFGGAIRLGGTPGEWIWRGDSPATAARIEARLSAVTATPELRYAVEFTESGNRLEIVDEVLEEAKKADHRAKDVRFYYRFQRGHPAINVSQVVQDATSQRKYKQRKLRRETIDPQQSILSQKKDVDLYPEVTTVGKRFGAVQIFREWSFGRSAALRTAQPANLPTDALLPDLKNLGLKLNHLEHTDVWPRFNELMQQFLPRYKWVSTKVSAGSVQIYLHEEGLNAPVPATRLSDGTLRFIGLLAILLDAESCPLICIEEPELGLHPDAVSLLGDLLIEASNQTQLIVTTHSDGLVSALTEHAESVLACDYLENGTTLQRLDPDNLDFWLQKYRLGEIWRLGKIGGNLW